MKVLPLIIILLMFSTVAIAQENTQENNASKKIQITTIHIDTKGKTGHLVYEEAYFVKNSSGNITLDHIRLFFDRNINASKIKFNISRPLKDGRQFIYIKALARLDNQTILNTWYKPSNNANAPNIDPNNAGSVENTPDNNTKKSPGFEGIVLVAAILMVCIFKKLDKK